MSSFIATRAGYMRELFPNGKTLEPVRPERLHCLVIHNTSYAG